MRGINLCFDYEDNEIKTRICYPEKVIELSYEQFSQFKSNPHGDYDFIEENKELMDEGNGNTYHGLLLLNKATDDGIFVMESPFRREVAFVPYVRYYLEKEQYPALSEYCRRMTRLVDENVTKALNHQEEGRYQIHMKPLCTGNDDGFVLDENLFLGMMQNRDEFEYVEGGWDDDEDEDIMFLGISKEHLKVEEDSDLRPLSQTDVDIICANHILWFNNAGGKQADFTNCFLRDVDLTRKNLHNAIFDGAKIANCSLSGSDFSFSSFVGTRFVNCDAFTFTAINSDFTEAKMSFLDIRNGNFERSNFTNAVLRGCSLCNVNLDDCCIDRADFTDSSLDGTNTYECFDDEKRWSAYVNGLGEQS